MKLVSKTLSHALTVGCGHAAVVSQRRVVDQLGRATGAQLDETLERDQIADVADGPHVPLYVGGNVRTEPLRRADAPVEYARVAAGQEGLFQGVRMPVKAHNFATGQGKQMVHRRTPCHRLADRLDEREVLGPREHPAARLGVRVDGLLQEGRQLRRALDLVDDRAVGELRQEGAGVLRREGPHVRRLDAHVRMPREDGPAKRRLAALARPREGNGRPPPGRFDQLRCKVSLDYHGP